MFAFAVMCASCGNGGNAVSDASQTDTLGIMSFNIRNSGAKFEDGKNCWDNRREAVAGMIAGTAPVMIGLQEMLPEVDAHKQRPEVAYPVIVLHHVDWHPFYAEV